MLGLGQGAGIARNTKGNHMIRFDFIANAFGVSEYAAYRGRDYLGRIRCDNDGALSSSSFSVTVEIVGAFNRHVAGLYDAARSKYPDAFPTTPFHRMKGGAA